MANFGEPIHVGEVLDDELREIGLTARQLAKKIKVPAHKVHRLLDCTASLNTDMALRLGRFFSTGATFWLNLQNAYDIALVESYAGKKIQQITPYKQIDSKHKSEAFEAIHTAISGLHKTGAIDKKTMQDFDKMCLENTKNKQPDFKEDVGNPA